MHFRNAVGGCARATTTAHAITIMLGVYDCLYLGLYRGLQTHNTVNQNNAVVWAVARARPRPPTQHRLCLESMLVYCKPLSCVCLTTCVPMHCLCTWIRSYMVMIAYSARTCAAHVAFACDRVDVCQLIHVQRTCASHTWRLRVIV